MSVRFKDNRKNTKRDTLGALERVLLRKALEVERNAKLSMRGGGIPHVPSAPGEPPRVDTGRLRASITHEMETVRGAPTGRVGTNVRYGRDLEIGRFNMQPRPWLRPALKKAASRSEGAKVHGLITVQ
jgi:hypothetical protein